MNYKHKVVLLLVALSVSLGAFSQNLNLRFQNVTVRKAMTELKQRTGYSFVYEGTDLNTKKKVTVNAQSVNEAVKQILQGQDATYEIQDKSIIIRRQDPGSGSGPTRQQTYQQPGGKMITASGRVVDEKGEPIIGATVMEKGTKNGTVTDLDGKYSLKVSEGSNLEISYIGYQNSLERAGGNKNITLIENTKALNEVVVIGYGTARKGDLTGSVSSFNGDDLKMQNSPQLSTQLQGQISGLQITRSTGDPANGSTIRVRGITTMSTNDPLVIVDGVPGNIDDVASEDVQDLQVLKDAASAAIYGSRAAAGVILITTKRAKSDKFSMTYNTEYGIDKATEKPTFANAIEWMQGYNELAYNDGASTMYSIYSEDQINNYSTNHISDPDNFPDTNWMKLGLKKSANHERHSFTLSGGTNKLKTIFSLNYYKANALYNNKNYEKFNIRTNNDYNINNWIHAVADINLIYNLSDTPQTYFSSVLNSLMVCSPMYNAYWSDGSFAAGKDGDNPLAAYALGGKVYNRNYQLRGKLQVNITPIKNFTFTAVASPDFYFVKGKSHRIGYSVRQLSGEYISGTGFSSTSESETRNDSHSLTMQFYANYNILLNQHSVNAMIGYEDYSYFWENESAQRTNYSLNNFPYLDMGPADYQYNSGTAGHNAYRSVFGRIMYSWADRYLFQANVRSDGSSRFAKGHRWGTFPSCSAGWVVSEEPWFKKKAGIIDYLKLRGSIGKLGNERIGSEFPYQALLTFGTNYLPNSLTGESDVVQTAYQVNYAFNDITWETTTTYDIGTDLYLLNNRLRFTYDWYYKETRNMLLEVGFPSYFGYNSPENNVAKMFTKGFDAELSWNDHFGDFKYGISVNLSDYCSKMGYMADKQVISSNNITEEGSYYQEWYAYKSKGVILNDAAMYDVNGNKIAVLTTNDKPGCIQYIDINNDGKITADDKVKLGNSLPEYLYGGSIWSEWKGFDFNLSFQGVGYQKCLWTWPDTPFEYQAYSCPSILIKNHWSPYATDTENAKAKYPMLSSNYTNIYAASDFYLFNGAYMRIKNISLGYTIPQEITKKFFINKFRIYLSVNDLPAFSHYPKGYDPEWNRNGDLIMTSYMFGLNLSF